MSAEARPETSQQHPGAARAELRRQLLARRLALSPQDYAALSAALRAQLRQHLAQLATLRVGFCWPINNEPDLLPLIVDWLAAGDPGFMALLPVVVNAGQALAFRAWRPGDELVADRYGIPTPTAGDFIVPQALLLPVNAFDAAGYRLGYGGGYFDRTLAVLAALTTPPLAVGVGFELARVDSINPQAHDMRLDAIVTEAGVRHFAAAPERHSPPSARL